MRKLKLQMQVSVDGFVCGPNGEMDWMVWDWDDDIKSYVGAITRNIDLIVLGRKLADGFIPAWEKMSADPETADEFAHKMNNTPKIVFTRDGAVYDHSTVSVFEGDAVAEVERLKFAAGDDIIVYGGAEFVSSLSAANLIDEYNLFVNPAAIGKGLAIFRDLSGKLPLRLVSATAFPCGIVGLRYEPAESSAKIDGDV